MSDARARRIALNEAQFRDINESLRDGLEQLTRLPDELEMVCECGHLECRRTVPVGPAAYERVRANARRFLVVPGHEMPDVERVVERHDAYLVVEKVAEGARIAEEADPRRRGPAG